jgi:4-diphosphocytidyl-2-C-methyl-D-erythritol kinase
MWGGGLWQFSRVHYLSALTLNSPAKINLMLAITGRRPDGFHELVSVVAPLTWGDTLTVEVGDDDALGEFALTCDDPAVPRDGSNLILKAAQAFRDATGWRGAATFTLTKRIPMGAGLGGGSSNAAVALRALNQLTGGRLSAERLAEVAAGVGSDCALFLRDGPVVMRGRGERVESLAESATARLRGRSVLVFKPAFGISTAWAYGQLAAAAPASYLPATEAEARLARWSERSATDQAGAFEELLFNNMEPAAFGKFPALPLLLERLQRDFGLKPRMSGSGSACFALLPADAPIPAITATIRRSWGESAVVVHAHLA